MTNEEMLKQIKDEIKDLDLGFADREYQAGIAYAIMKITGIIDKHLKEIDNDNVQNCFNEILDYMNDKSVTWRDISDDIINDILKKYGFKKE